jgi:hypothetical protein
MINFVAGVAEYSTQSADLVKTSDLHVDWERGTEQLVPTLSTEPGAVATGCQTQHRFWCSFFMLTRFKIRLSVESSIRSLPLTVLYRV